MYLQTSYSNTPILKCYYNSLKQTSKSLTRVHIFNIKGCNFIWELKKQSLPEWKPSQGKIWPEETFFNLTLCLSLSLSLPFERMNKPKLDFNGHRIKVKCKNLALETFWKIPDPGINPVKEIIWNTQQQFSTTKS